MDKLLTKKDLAEHWQVTVKAIDNWRKDGILNPCSEVPVIRFSTQYIAELEGVRLEKFSPLERQRLERELEEWKQRAERAEKTLNKVHMIIMEDIYLRSNDE